MKWKYAVLLALLSSATLQAVPRDPTRPADYIQNNQAKTPFVLSSIIISPKRRIAVINGVFVKIGDKIDGHEVIAIESNSVQLQGYDGRLTLYLFSSPVVRRSE